MKKPNLKTLETIIAALLFIASFNANAQSLPGVQKVSFRAPANVKIDGKATEWDNKFQAYNNATEVFYTIANDDDNLYLTLHATKTDIISKILLGGVTLTVNLSDKKKDKETPAVTFPIHDKKDMPNINLVDQPKPTKDSALNKIKIDSFIYAINKKLSDKSKDIRVTGIKAIADTILSIYNQQGIKAAALFDINVSYTYELAVPLKYFGLSVNTPKQFAYNIKLNGTTGDHTKTELSGSGNSILVYSGNEVAFAIPNTPRYLSMAYPTDFWGQYTLAKK